MGWIEGAALRFGGGCGRQRLPEPAPSIPLPPTQVLMAGTAAPSHSCCSFPTTHTGVGGDGGREHAGADGGGRGPQARPQALQAGWALCLLHTHACGTI